MIIMSSAFLSAAKLAINFAKLLEEIFVFFIATPFRKYQSLEKNNNLIPAIM